MLTTGATVAAHSNPYTGEILNCDLSRRRIRCCRQQDKEGDYGNHRSNETELSHRWRERALLRVLVLKSSESYSSERPAVGCSDWLDPLRLAGRLSARTVAMKPTAIRLTRNQSQTIQRWASCTSSASV